MVSGTAIAALICLGVVQITVTVLHILVARLVRQVVREAAISVMDSVGPIDTVDLIGGVANIVIVGSSCGG